jgi:hypothetical protein
MNRKYSTRVFNVFNVFIVYVAKMSITQLIQCRMLGRLISDELESI